VEGRPLVDLDKATTDRMVERFGIMAQDADIALFYFSGHGMQIGGTNTLSPLIWDQDRSRLRLSIFGHSMRIWSSRSWTSRVRA
jgi:hypothetical protein